MVNGQSRYTAPDSGCAASGMQPLTIRPAALDDLETITALTAAAYRAYIPLLGRLPLPMTVDYRPKVLNQEVDLLSWGPQPVGVLVWAREPEALLIESVAVSPAFQRRGCGRYLLAWAEQRARHAGYSRIRLYTNDRLPDKVRWYLRLGYQEIDREPYRGSAWVHLAKSLEIEVKPAGCDV